jgi:NAD(P)-dependent dehydrogenase (short-subunit alcohol dehydrogenase family)
MTQAIEGPTSMKLNGKVAIVTGAGRNIGEAAACLFATEGAAVAVVDINGAAAEKVAADIRSRGGKAIAVQTDVSQEDDVVRLVEATCKAFGAINILVNNVAITDKGSLLDLTVAEWDRVMAVTLRSPFIVTKHVATRMIETGQTGAIVNISSTSGHRGRANATAYSTAKAGILNLTRSMAIQLAPHGIRVNSLSPNRIGSPVGKQDIDPSRGVINLLKRPGDPNEVAKSLLFLVSDDSSFIVAEDILVDGGSRAG